MKISVLLDAAARPAPQQFQCTASSKVSARKAANAFTSTLHRHNLQSAAFVATAGSRVLVQAGPGTSATAVRALWSETRSRLPTVKIGQLAKRGQDQVSTSLSKEHSLEDLKQMVEKSLKAFKDFLKKYETAKDKFLKHRQATNVILKNLDRSYNRALDDMYEEAEELCDGLFGVNDDLIDAGGKSMIDDSTHSHALEWLNDRIHRAADWAHATVAK